MTKALHNNKYTFCLGILAAALVLFVPVHFVFAGPVDEFLYSMSVGIGSALLWMGGNLFDYSITYLVIEMGQLAGTGTGIGGAIDSLWTIIRDIFNLLFIFGLIYIGFKTILNSEDSGTRRALGTLIAAALLINFSLYATKAIVDFSNIAAFQVYRAISVEPADSSVGSNARIKGFSELFVGYSKLSSYTDPNSRLTTEAASEADGVSESVRIIVFGFLIMIFMLIAAFVFAAGAMLFVARFIALVIFMIFSPAMFLGWVYPGFSKYSSMWWNKFLSQAFVAPAFLFMLYLSFKILSVLNVNGSFKRAFSNESTASGLFEIFLYFFVIIGFLIASLLVAKQMGAVGANSAIKVGRNISGAAARTTVGNAANIFHTDFEKMRRSNNFLARGLGGLINVSGVNSIAKAGANSKFGGTQSAVEREKEVKEISGAVARNKAITNIKAQARKGSGRRATDGQKINAERAVAGASTAQLEEMPQGWRVKNAHLMSDSQVEGLMKSDKLNDAQKSALHVERGKKASATYTSNPSLLSKASVSDLTTLGYDFLSKEENAVRLSSSAMDDLKKKITPTEFANISSKRTDARVSVANGTSVGGYALADLQAEKPEEIAAMPDDVFGNNEFTKTLAPAALAKVIGKKNSTVQNEIKRVIVAAAAATPGGPSARSEEWFRVNPTGRTFASS